MSAFPCCGNFSLKDAAVIVTDHEIADYELVMKKARFVMDTRNIIKKRGLQSAKLWTA